MNTLNVFTTDGNNTLNDENNTANPVIQFSGINTEVFAELNEDNIGFDFQEDQIKNDMFKDKNELNWPWISFAKCMDHAENKIEKDINLQKNMADGLKQVLINQLGVAHMESI